MATQKQAEANRQNAQKSTGPKTEEGKGVAKHNAVKHGILSDAVVIIKGEGQERKEAYLMFHNSLRDYFQPQGTMEDALVEQIVVTFWRKRRVLRFELGCLRKQLDTYQEAYRKREEDEFLHRKSLTAYQKLEAARERLERSQQGVEALKGGADILSDEGAEEWEENYNAVAERRCNMEGQESTAVEIRDWLIKGGLNEAQIRQELLQIDEEEALGAKAEIKELEVKVALELEQAALLASLPASGHELDKIIRYEASLDRQLYKAINQLERLQRRRKGEDFPAPVVLDET